MRRLAAAPLLAALACSAGAPPAPPFRLDVGRTWTYVDAAGREYRTTVERATEINGEPCVVIRGATVGITDDRMQADDVAVVAVRAGVPHLIGVGQESWAMGARDSIALVRPDAPRGKIWGGRFSGGGETCSVKLTSGGTGELGVPAGRYLAHRVVEEWTFRGSPMVTIDNWYADDAGLIRSVYRMHTGNASPPFALDLKEVR